MPRERAFLSIALKRRTGDPIYQQIVGQIERAFARGDLQPGDRLPTVRALSQEIGVNQMTVAKAYKSLGAKGLLEGRKGGGTSVRRPIDPSASPSVQAAVADRL